LVEHTTENRGVAGSNPAPATFPWADLSSLAMIERIDDMPAGTIGLRASGKLSREDYQ
jgi:hypothetical protein